ncbi:MAG: N-methyl-L-tryptophan oxidase [Actinomycetota bacterium]
MTTQPDRGPEERFDLIVVGLGAMGAATTYQARRQGLSVLGIDRHHPPHTLGSTHAETRVTRLAVGEGPQYLPFVARSHEIWRELEARSGEALLHLSGGYIITDPEPVAGQRWEDFVVATDRIAAEAGIPFHLVDPSMVPSAGQPGPPPRIRGLDGKRIGFEPTGGVVMAERAVAVQLDLAKDDGATVRTGETVTAIEPASNGVTVVTDRTRYRADRAVLATGPWLPELADQTDIPSLAVTRQTVFWFEVDDVAAFGTDRFSFIIWAGQSDDDYVGVFPIPPGGTPALKVLGEQFAETTDPHTVDRTVSDDEIADFHRRLVAGRIDGVTDRCVKAQVCLYTNTPDDHFLIDTVPGTDRVLQLSPCSGHGFKHSAAIGEAVAAWAAGTSTTLDLRPFARRANRA